MKLIITGSSGFVGKNLLSYLDHDVVQLNRESLTALSFSLITSGDVIIHLAGKAHDLKNISEPQEYYKVNFELTKKLYDAFLESDARKFIFISSVKAVADSVDGILTENVLPNPQTDYGKSKLMAEEYIMNQPLPPEKVCYILRPCMIHGPGNKGNLNLLYKVVKRGVPYPLASFENKRSLLSIENLCFVIRELILRDDIEGGVYHIADDEPLSTNIIVSILADSLNVKPRLWRISKGLIQLLAKTGDLLSLPLTTERLKKLTESYIVSNQKIKNALGKQFPLTAPQGLQITAKSFGEF